MDGAPPEAIPLLLVIDVEPDEFFVDRDAPGRWEGFERGVLWMASLRARLAAAGAGPVRFCWAFRLDRQIRDTWGRSDWAFRHYRGCIDEFRLHGDALGVHPHLYRWLPERRRWLVDQGDPEWVIENLALSLETFLDTMGHEPDFFRFGDHWMSDEAMAWLNAAGVPFDLSLEPGVSAMPTLHSGQPYTGHIPGQRTVPRSPYRPALDNFRKPDATGRTRIIAIPCTTGRVRPPTLLRQQPSPRNAWAWLRYHSHPWFDVAGLFQEPMRLRMLIDDALQAGARHLSLTLRTDTFSKGLANGHLERAFDALLSHPEAHRFRWTTPEDLVRRIAPELMASDGSYPGRAAPPRRQGSGG